MSSQLTPQQTSTISGHGIKSYLSGCAPLWKAFWGLLFLGTLTSVVLEGLLIVAYFEIFPWSFGESSNLLTILFFAVNIPYMLFAWVAVWRCAANTSNRFFLVLARVIVLIDAVWYLRKFVIFLLRGVKFGLFQ
jgi:hypothetical protein